MVGNGAEWIVWCAKLITISAITASYGVQMIHFVVIYLDRVTITFVAITPPDLFCVVSRTRVNAKSVGCGGYSI